MRLRVNTALKLFVIKQITNISVEQSKITLLYDHPKMSAGISTDADDFITGSSLLLVIVPSSVPTGIENKSSESEAKGCRRAYVHARL
jgi:hypothetical protein